MTEAALRMKIMVLDDSAAYLAFARRTVSAAGHTFVGCSAWSELGQRISQERPDAVLVDVTMPVLQGFKVVDIVRRHWAELPVILMSGEPEELLERRALESGADGYLRKLDLATGLNRALDAAAERIDARRHVRHADRPALDLRAAADLARSVPEAEFSRSRPGVAFMVDVSTATDVPAPPPRPARGKELTQTWGGPRPDLGGAPGAGFGPSARVVWPVPPEGPEATTRSFVIGRDPACEIVLDHARISRYHAIIRQREGAWEVEDAGSANGTSLEGLELRRREPRTLLEGARVLLGGVAVVVPYFTPRRLRRRLRADDLAPPPPPERPGAPSAPPGAPRKAP